MGTKKTQQTPTNKKREKLLCKKAESPRSLAASSRGGLAEQEGGTKGTNPAQLAPQRGSSPSFPLSRSVHW